MENNRKSFSSSMKVTITILLLEIVTLIPIAISSILIGNPMEYIPGIDGGNLLIGILISYTTILLISGAVNLFQYFRSSYNNLILSLVYSISISIVCGGILGYIILLILVLGRL